ncbi:uncharacterized protein LOC103580168 [Microplitis demolitor]|uniref:uncharacterized protein LOC103580168 n=1 Tax=Microplitis demolitor TaxID=69319 RepID=UPI0004CDC927|nr:uncharacterized protein LOC103580168 [Microplitis demolitor]
MQICAQIVAWAWDFLMIGRTPYSVQNPIQLHVTDDKKNEVLLSDGKDMMKDTTTSTATKETSEVDRGKNKKDMAPWRLPTPTSMISSQGNPLTPISSPQYLSPNVFQGRNSLCSAHDYNLRRRRPMTLKIGPRLVPHKSTSAPTSTTDGEWPAHSGKLLMDALLLVSGFNTWGA